MMTFYLIGCLVSFSIITKRRKDCKDEMLETMFSPILVLLSWVYVIMYTIKYLDNKWG